MPLVHQIHASLIHRNVCITALSLYVTALNFAKQIICSVSGQNASRVLESSHTLPQDPAAGATPPGQEKRGRDSRQPPVCTFTTHIIHPIRSTINTAFTYAFSTNQGWKTMY